MGRAQENKEISKKKLFRKPDKKRQLRILVHSMRNNIKVDFKEIWWENVY